ncbi:hypothetical protein PG997_012637 [Apiospora hydei]|uniref:Uncharacterized protein n=1 Tax=Apiospora hydei TaxID=1337664 RepID=A0ABR1V3W2_9PEZI
MEGTEAADQQQPTMQNINKKGGSGPRNFSGPARLKSVRKPFAMHFAQICELSWKTNRTQAVQKRKTEDNEGDKPKKELISQDSSHLHYDPCGAEIRHKKHMPS